MEIIKLKNICKSYEGRTIFNQYSLTIHDNEIVVIMGKSGSGKTTLLNIIGLLEPINSGCIYLYDKIVTKKDIKKIHREKIGFLFQNYALLEEKSVLYNLNIVYPTKKERKNNRTKVLDVLKEVHLEDYENKKVCQCSGGEKQRIAIARALLHNSRIILCDEPTGSLDKDNRDMIMKMFLKLKQKGKTLVIVTHDEKMTAIADRVIQI